jgi:hypothetical protein
MSNTMMYGVVVVVLAGLLQGSGGWPIKVMRKFQFEHWAFVGMLGGLIVIPWIVTLSGCPDALAAYRSVDPKVLIKSNIFSLSWGVANILCMLCFVRIGFCLTGGILTGIGVSLGVVIPMIFKGSGLFKNASDITSLAGLTVVGGVAVMLLGVLQASLAGFGRDKALQKAQATSGSFLVGLLMVVAAGVLSCGISFAFVYSQGPIVEAMKARGAADIPANFAVWAVGLLGGGLVNVLYPAYLMTKKKSWNVLGSSGKEFVLALIISVNISAGIALMGKGMLMLGALGASVGFGIQQAMQMLGGQGVGFIGGEWRGVDRLTRCQMYVAIVALILAAVFMAYGNSVTNT